MKDIISGIYMGFAPWTDSIVILQYRGDGDNNQTNENFVKSIAPIANVINSDAFSIPNIAKACRAALTGDAEGDTEKPPVSVYNVPKMMGMLFGDENRMTDEDIEPYIGKFTAAYNKDITSNTSYNEKCDTYYRPMFGAYICVVQENGQAPEVMYWCSDCKEDFAYLTGPDFKGLMPDDAETTLMLLNFCLKNAYENLFTTYRNAKEFTGSDDGTAVILMRCNQYPAPLFESALMLDDELLGEENKFCDAGFLLSVYTDGMYVYGTVSRSQNNIVSLLAVDESVSKNSVDKAAALYMATNELLESGNVIDTLFGQAPEGWVLRTVKEISENPKLGPIGNIAFRNSNIHMMNPDVSFTHLIKIWVWSKDGKNYVTSAVNIEAMPKTEGLDDCIDENDSIFLNITSLIDMHGSCFRKSAKDGVEAAVSTMATSNPVFAITMDQMARIKYAAKTRYIDNLGDIDEKSINAAEKRIKSAMATMSLDSEAKTEAEPETAAEETTKE